MKKRRLYILLMAAGVAAAALILIVDPVRIVQSGRLMLAVISEADGGAAAVERRAFPYAASQGRKPADLYLPRQAGGAVLVLVPGAHRQGRREPRLVNLAEDFARAGFHVVVPQIGAIRALQVSPDDSKDIAAVLRHVSSQPETAGLRSGLVAISYAAGPAIIASLRLDAQTQPAFIVLLGPYYDLEATIRYFTTGYYREPAAPAWQRRDPNRYGKWIFAHSNAARLNDPEDRTLLEAIARRKQRNEDADVSGLVRQMGPEGRAVYALLENRDPAQTPALIDALPDPIRQAIAVLDVSRYGIGRTRMDFYLIHGRDDRIIPYTETLALARHLPRDRRNVYILDNLAHVDPAEINIRDVFRLWRFFYALLGER